MNEHPGFGVMIGMLGGNRETVEAHNAAMGKTIFKAEMIDNRFRLHFNDETGIIFYDDGQSCCECRYMHTDDNLESFANSIFIEAELAEGPEVSDEYGDLKECQFLRIRTSSGIITIANYNEHNGYYGGFWIVIREISKG